MNHVLPGLEIQYVKGCARSKMKKILTSRLLSLSLAWVMLLVFGMSYGKWSEVIEEVSVPVTLSREIIIPRDLYQESFEVVFDSETRDLWQKPDQVLEVAALEAGMTVADIGCGEGYFTRRIASIVGSEGLVYATDIQKEVLDRMQESLPAELTSVVHPILAGDSELGIPQAVDMVFLIQVLGEVANQRQFLKQIMSIMKPQAKLVLIDSKHLTDRQTGYARPVNLSRLLLELEKTGLTPAEPPIHFLPKQFFLILKKKNHYQSQIDQVDQTL